MKKMKRLVAVLLAGVMVLAMLTACGCGSSTPTSDVEKAEALYMDIYNAVLDAEYKNDADLKVQAKRLLEDSLDEDGKLKSGKKMIDTKYDNLSVWTTVTILAQPENKTVPYGITSEQLATELANKDATIAKIKEDLGSYRLNLMKTTTTDLAVGAVKKGDKIYVAIAMKTKK